jgi:hypothetical protein
MRQAAIQEYLDDIIMNMHRPRVRSRGRRTKPDQSTRHVRQTPALLKRVSVKE